MLNDECWMMNVDGCSWSWWCCWICGGTTGRVGLFRMRLIVCTLSLLGTKIRINIISVHVWRKYNSWSVIHLTPDPFPALALLTGEGSEPVRYFWFSQEHLSSRRRSGPRHAALRRLVIPGKREFLPLKKRTVLKHCLCDGKWVLFGENWAV